MREDKPSRGTIGDGGGKKGLKAWYERA